MGILAGRPRRRHVVVPEKPVMRRCVAVYGLGLLAAVMAGPAHAAIVVDGLVGGLAEGYTSEFNAVFDIEGGPLGVAGGTLFLHETATTFNVGFVTKLTINDNTYGANKALDWGSKDHFLFGKGGKSLEGSDKWVLTIPVTGAADLFFDLDYIVADKTTGDYAASIKTATQGPGETPDKSGTALDQSGIMFATSLDYNFNVLGLTQFFDTDKDNPIASPGPAPGPASGPIYLFDSPAEAWVAEIMYEFKVDKSIFTGMVDLAGLIDDDGVFHMSPNKLGGNKVFFVGGTEVTPVPLPAALPLFLSALAGLAFIGRRRGRQARA